jgi:kynurenine formamidase
MTQKSKGQIVTTLLLIALCGIYSVNAQTTVKGDGNAGELNSLELDALANQLMDSNANMKVVARLGDGETDSSLNQTRLETARKYLIEMRGIDKATVTFTEGESIKGEGRLEFYLDNELMLISLAERGKDVRIGCCGDEEDPPTTETNGTDVPMEAKALAALIKELKEVVSKNSPDKNESKLVADKWDKRKDLAGKTKSEVIELLFEDVKSVIKDSGIQYQIYSVFSFYKNIPDEFVSQNNCATASKFGAGDQIGNLNYVTAEKTLTASKLVKTGKSYSLAIETNKDMPAFPPRSFSLTVVQPNQTGGATLGPTKSTYNDDIIMGWVGVGTGIDGLGHVGIDNLYFNCNKAADFAAPDGLKKLGVENIPAVVTRGILLDMAGYLKTDMVKEGTAFNRAEIEGAMKRQGIKSIEQGDVVMFYTGWMKLMGKDNKRFAAGNAGIGIEGANYLASRGVAIVGADNENLEVVPFESGAGVFEVHQILLAKNGIYIIENMNLEEMVKDKAWESMFVLGSPKITGGVQSFVNPIAVR